MCTAGKGASNLSIDTQALYPEALRRCGEEYLEQAGLVSMRNGKTTGLCPLCNLQHHESWHAVKTNQQSCIIFADIGGV